LLLGPVPVQFCWHGSSSGFAGFSFSGTLPDLCSRIFARAGSLPRISRVREVSLPLHGPDLFGHLANLAWHLYLWHLAQSVFGHLVRAERTDIRRRILYRLHDLCPRIFLGRHAWNCFNEASAGGLTISADSDCQLQERQQLGRASARPCSRSKPERPVN